MNSSINLSRFLRDTSRRHGDREGLVWRERAWTWGEISERVNALASAFRELGVEKGRRVMLFCQNSNYMFEAMWAGFQCGAVIVPTNFRLSPSEASYIARSSNAEIFFYDAEFEKHSEAVKANCASLRSIVCTSESSPGSIPVETLIDSCRSAPIYEVEAEYDDDAWLFYTSGTTGRPKAARLTHGQMTFVTTNYLADLLPGLDCNDSSMVVAPLSHGAGIHMLPNVARGSKSVIMPHAHFDAECAFDLIEKHRVTNLFTVPTIVNMLTESEAWERCDHSSLKQVVYAGAPMYREDQIRALRRLGKVLVQYYGLGEVTGCITYLPAAMHSDRDDDMRVGTCGVVRTGMQVEIRNGTGHPVPDGQTGEVWVKGAGVFAGYLDDDEANTEAFRDGWFHTGDMGYLDAAGFLYLTGRSSEMYISGGTNIYPREIEDALLQHPGIRKAAVVGVPDRKWGEVGVAVIVTGHQVSLSADDISEFLKERIASYKCPKQFHFWNDIPVSAYGKVSKKEICDMLESGVAKR